MSLCYCCQRLMEEVDVGSRTYTYWCQRLCDDFLEIYESNKNECTYFIQNEEDEE